MKEFGVRITCSQPGNNQTKLRTDFSVFQILVDDLLVYNGIMEKSVPTDQKTSSKTVIFNIEENTFSHSHTGATR